MAHCDGWPCKCNATFSVRFTLRVAVSGLVLVLPALQAADSSHARNDVFASYREAIDARMVEILNRATAPESPPGENGVKRTEQPAEPATATLREYANRYWRGREDNLRRALERLDQIRPVLEGILESEGLPKSLVAVVLVESAGDPLALSPKDARGLWQFIPATARQYGLTVSSKRDDRIHTEQATRAAARFLRDLYEKFQDWPLALAAYNAGKQAVERAVQKSRGDDFWSLSSQRLLPEETRNYVPAVLSAMRLFGDGLPLATRSEPHRAGRSDWVYANTGVSN
jgi:soluble lytic murein transglycosylase-like protein